MPVVRIIDVTDPTGFARIPPCVDPGFDHRTCDYWEDDRRGSKAARLSWLLHPHLLLYLITRYLFCQ